MKNNKINLLEGGIFKTLIKISTPLMATAFVDMAYNFTDTAWLGRLGKDAVSGTGSTHIFIWIAFSIMLVAKIGTTVYASQEYGKKDFNSLYNTVKNGFVLNLIIITLYFIVIQLFAPKLIGFYNLSESVTEIGVSYLRTMSFGAIFSLTNPLITGMYNSLGDSVHPFKINVVGLIFNLIVDPIFIFTFDLGYVGAALATILAQLLVFSLFMYNIFKSKNEIYVGIFRGKVKFENILRKIKMGLPAGIQSIVHATISLILSRFLTSYGDEPLGIFTIGAMVESITWMTTEGFQAGIISFVGQNYGARNYERLKDIIKTSMFTVATIGLIGSFILITFRNNIYQLFLPGEEKLIKMGAYYLLILGFSQFFMAVEIGGAGVFSGLGDTKTPAMVSMFLNLLRIPMAIFFMQYFEFYGVWIAISLSSVFKGILQAVLLYIRTRKKFNFA